MTKRIFIQIITCLLLASCKEKLPFIKALHQFDINEKQLGTSGYYIKLPESFNMIEVHGKEGTLIYDIVPRDTASTIFGYIILVAGKPIGENLSERKKAVAFARSAFNDKDVKWKIYQTEAGYFDAFTDEKGDLNAGVSSKRREDVDAVISIIASLQKK